MKPTLNEQASRFREAMINFGTAIAEASRAARIFDWTLRRLPNLSPVLDIPRVPPRPLLNSVGRPLGELVEQLGVPTFAVSGEFVRERVQIPNHLSQAILENRIGKFIIYREQREQMARDFPRMFLNTFQVETSWSRNWDFDGTPYVAYSPLFEPISYPYDYANDEYQDIDLPEYEIFWEFDTDTIQARLINQLEAEPLNREGRKPRVCKRENNDNS